VAVRCGVIIKMPKLLTIILATFGGVGAHTFSCYLTLLFYKIDIFNPKIGFCNLQNMASTKKTLEFCTGLQKIDSNVELLIHTIFGTPRNIMRQGMKHPISHSIKVFFLMHPSYKI
jgi:hypothetical protein